MRRNTGMLVAGWLACAAGTATAQTQTLLVNGDPKIAVIDADDNGSITDPTDCMFGATIDAGSNLTVTGMQAPGPNLLRACTGSCFGSGFASVDFLEVQIQACNYHAHTPILADFCDTVESCDQVGMAPASEGAGRGAGTAPVELVSGVLAVPAIGLERVGFGILCSAGGPAVQITDKDGLTVLRQLIPFPNAQSPTHMCVDNIPVELDNGQFVLRTGCFPSGPNGTTFALSGSPGSPFALFNYSGLPSCGAAQGAPAASTWGLAALLAGLLAAGVWTLRRRSGFAASLPLP